MDSAKASGFLSGENAQTKSSENGILDLREESKRIAADTFTPNNEREELLENTKVSELSETDASDNDNAHRSVSKDNMSEREPLLASGRHSANVCDGDAETDDDERRSDVAGNNNMETHNFQDTRRRNPMGIHGKYGYRSSSVTEGQIFSGSRAASVTERYAFPPRPGSVNERYDVSTSRPSSVPEHYAYPTSHPGSVTERYSRPGSVQERRSLLGSRSGSATDATLNSHEDDDSSNYHDYDQQTDVSRNIPSGETVEQVKIKVYKVRWYILMVFSLCVTLQNATWGTWGPIAESAKLVYDWDTKMIFIIVNCGNVGVLLPALLTGYMISTRGLRFSMIVCSFLLVLGTGLRAISKQNSPGTILVGFGQFFNGLAGSVTQVIPAALSETWFPLNERATATAIGVISNCAGSVVAFMLGPNIVDEPSGNSVNSSNGSADANGTFLNATATEKDTISKQIWILTMIEFGVGVALFVLVLAYFPARPPTPPSRSAKEERINFTKGLCSVFRKPLLVLLMLSFAVPWAVYGNWMGLINVNFHHIGISQNQSGWFGFYASVSGMVGGTIIGRIADRFQRRLKLFVIAALILSLCLVVWVTCMRNGYIYKSTALLAVGIAILGMLMAAALPLCYEMACERGYPVHEGVIGMFVSIAINLSAVVFLLVKFVPDIGVNWMNWTLVGVLGLGLLCLLMIQERYSRTDVDITVVVQPSK